MKRFRSLNTLPLFLTDGLGEKQGLSRRGQRGASLIAAIFVITALLVLGGLMTQLIVLGSEETVNEWYSSQALYAAESGVDYAVWDLTNGGGGVIVDGDVITNKAWMTTTVTTTSYNGGAQLHYTITSTGEAGGTSGSPRAQRQIRVQYMP
jgi:hypothetical protein